MNILRFVVAPVAIAILGLCHSPAHAAPTTSTTTVDLGGVTQNWDKTLPSEPGAGCPNWSTRFTCVMNNAGVRDNETGLVWTHPLPYVRTWYEAKQDCLNLAVGNRKGWRLPSVTELASLVDMSNPGEPKLPANRPFIYQQQPGTPYWTSTTHKSPYSNTTPTAYVVYFQNGMVSDQEYGSSKLHVWCVRGGQAETNLY